MTNEEIKQVIELAVADSQVIIEGEGCHCHAIIVSDVFLNQSRVARQQMVLASLGSQFASGELHAMTMKTWTVDEWEKKNG